MSFVVALAHSEQQCEVSCPCKLIPSGNVSIFTAAQTNDYSEVVDKVNTNPSLLTLCDDYGYTALHYASHNNNHRIVAFLLAKAKSMYSTRSTFVIDANKCGCTPLHRAAFHNAYESAELLLYNDANVNAIDMSFGDSRTPLHKAYSKKNTKIVDLLLRYGADESIRDRAGKLPKEAALDDRGGGEGTDDIDNTIKDNIATDDVMLCQVIETTSSVVAAEVSTAGQAAYGVECSECFQLKLSVRKIDGAYVCKSCVCNRLRNRIR